MAFIASLIMAFSLISAHIFIHVAAIYLLKTKKTNEKRLFYTIALAAYLLILVVSFYVIEKIDFLLFSPESTSYNRQQLIGLVIIIFGVAGYKLVIKIAFPLMHVKNEMLSSLCHRLRDHGIVIYEASSSLDDSITFKYADRKIIISMRPYFKVMIPKDNTWVDLIKDENFKITRDPLAYEIAIIEALAAQGIKTLIYPINYQPYTKDT